jgi:hypothetical protein
MKKLLFGSREAAPFPAETHRLVQYLGRVALLGLVALFALGLALATPTTPAAHAQSPARGGLVPAVPTAVPSAIPTLPGPLPTVTPCVVILSDVSPNHPFYTYIRCLVCHGVVSGYACGGPNEPCPGLYFRPGANITRGQLAKLVANSAGFTEAVTTQTFQDVPPGSTFYSWVERLARRTVMSGYACGGPNEPCVPPANRPYFRPGVDVTRSQLAKIVANAAHYTDTPTGETFQDIPTSHPLWLWIERMARHGSISGYACGGPGEPCGPGNRPYFRPGNTATRGQVAKTAASTFFPNCNPRSKP